MTCEHNGLIALDDFTGSAVDVKYERDIGHSSKVCGMFMYKKYKCINCKKIITILQAVVEEAENE